MNKKALLFAAVVLVPTAPQAVEMGLGMSARSDDAVIYVPINLNPGFRIEPFFAFSQSETSVGGVSVETESRTLGAGAFVRLEAADRLQPYVGGRVGYAQVETTTLTGSADADSLSVEPTIGVEFFVTERFSVGAEAFAYYAKTDSGVGSDSDATGTGTRLLVRVMP